MTPGGDTCTCVDSAASRPAPAYSMSAMPGAAVAGTVRLYERSYALVIGIDDYSSGWPRLSKAVADAG